VQHWMQHLLVKQHLPGNGWLAVAVSTIATILIAIASFWLFERPIRRLHAKAAIRQFCGA
jgi:peptidoglycan/LPS O-acetylase OafA/YrhL